MSRSARTFRLSYVVLATVLAACGGGSPDPSASVLVKASATTASLLEGPNGSSLSVPAGASAADVTIVLSAPQSRRPAPAGTTAVAEPLRLSPEGQTFEKALELTIPISPSALPVGRTIDEVVVLRAPQGSDAFVPIPTRRNGNAVVAQTEHFSDFLAVVFDDPASPPFGACTDAICAPEETCGGCPFDCGLCFPSSDTTPPSVQTITSPTATGVRGDAVVSIAFSEPLLPASVSTLAIELVTGGTKVDGTFAIVDTLVTFTPTNGLAPNRTYTLTVNGVRDLGGNVMTTPFTTSFTTMAGASLIGSSPADGATGVSQYASVSLMPSDAIAPATLALQPTDGPCSGTVQISVDGFATCLGGTVTAVATNLDLATTYPLPASSTVDVRFTAAAVDSFGFSLALWPVLSFVTGADVTGPSVRSLDPADNATGVLPTSPIVLDFDEPVDPASLDTSTVQLSGSAGLVTGTFAVNGRTVTFTPSSPLLPATNYSLLVSSVKDALGNSNGNVASSVFRTVERPAVVASSPGANSVGVHPRQDLVLTFSRAMNASTFTMQASDSATCTGSVQVSDGTTCYGGAIEITSPTTITIRPTSSLPLGRSISTSLDATVLDQLGIAVVSGPVLAFVVSPVNGFAYVISDGPWSAGDTGGIAGADHLCDPTDSGTRKAFLMASTRYACSTPNCASAGETGPVDWVFSPNTTYVNASGQLLFTTDATYPIFTAWPMAIVYEAIAINFLFGGNAAWQPTGATCADWTNGTASAGAYTCGYLNAADNGWISGGSIGCDVARPVLCVGQPPAQPPMTH